MSNTKANTYCQKAMAHIDDLRNAPLKPLKDRLTGIYDAKNNKGAGVYAIYENDALMYIGRSDNVSQRLQNHYTNSDGARLAIKLNGNKEDANLKKQMDRVKGMSVRFLEVTDPNLQALTELLATIELNPPYNDFENH